MKTHIVHKICLQIPASNFEKAREQQSKAVNWTKHVFPNLLNKILDKVSKEKSFLFIDKLEIEIPEMPWKISEQQWAETIERQILKEKITTLPFLIIFEEWLFYLINGCFKNNGIIKNKNDFESYFLENLSEFTNHASILINEVFNTLISIKRLFLNFNGHFIENILILTFSISQTEAKQIYTFTKKEISDNTLAMQARIELAFSILQKKETSNKKLLFEIIDKNLKKKDLEKLNIDSKIQENLQQKLEEKEHPLIDDYFCKHSGLVLLLPFLNSLFENLGLLETNQFKNDECQVKGIQLLHFLATGLEQAEEEDLILPKILCGVAIQEFILIPKMLEQQKKEECNILLQSVIEYWQVLKNTSVDGLRNSFLQRTGRLKEDNQQYILEVEDSGIDILLDKVPWGFRNFKLPWMKKPIQTQWY
ncbi:MAG TPA: contractile injection system tape measure protein [Edaphocola sp.]|nr:contractile injection system tape measure protein [Edaphocola sp.]